MTDNVRDSKSSNQSRAAKLAATSAEKLKALGKLPPERVVQSNERENREQIARRKELVRKLRDFA